MSTIVDPAVARTRTRPLSRRLLHLARRGHLYVGLFMIPWVLLYAVTGFLLNHDTVWPEGEVRPVTPDLVAGTGLDALPTAADLAADVTAALNARAGSDRYRLADPNRAVFEWDTFLVEATAGGHRVRLALDPVTGTGLALLTPADGPAPAPFDAPDGVFGRDKLEDRLKAGAPELLTRLGTPADKPAVPWLPGLVFAVTDADGRVWTVRYDQKTGAVRGRPAETADPEHGFKRFLYTLHFSHAYPESTRLRTAWAVFVDLTAGALVFWCLTGLAMWWQIKAVRRVGAVVLVSSLLTAAVLGVAMYRMLHP